MQSKIVDEIEGRRTHVLLLGSGEEVLSSIKDYSEKHIRSGYFHGIGALKYATLGYFDIETMGYKEIIVSEQVEVLSIIGNTSRQNGKVVIHAHVILGKSDGSTIGGHLLDATVWPRLELVMVETIVELHRTLDPETGLTLLDLSS